MHHEVVSHHFLRRTARKRKGKLAAKDRLHTYDVVPARRGPYRWLVVRTRI